MHLVSRYNRIRLAKPANIQPRTALFSGKAAPGYLMAKRIVRLINYVADIVNNDPAVEGLLKIVFIPNYDVQTAEDLIPAGDLSEQISMAGTEASCQFWSTNVRDPSMQERTSSLNTSSLME